MKLKRIDRYLLGEFMAPLLLVVLGLAGVVWLAQFVDTLPRLRDWKAPYMLIFFHHLFKFPFLATQVVPIGIMLATLVSLGNLARNSELMAFRAGGVSAIRIAMPIIAMSFAGSLLLLVLSESVVPWASYKARYIQKVMIETRSMVYDQSWRTDMAKSLPGNRQMFAKQFDAPSGTLQYLVILTRDGEKISSRIDARKATYNFSGRSWQMTEGIERTFGDSGELISSREFTRWPLELDIAPDDFMFDADRKEEDLVTLPIAELRRIIDVLKSTGADFRKELTCLHLRISYPFSCFILALLGVSVPFLFPSGKRSMMGAALGGLIALSTGIGYLVFVQVGLSMGKSGMLPPLLAAWIANILFAILGGLALWKINR